MRVVVVVRQHFRVHPHDAHVRPPGGDVHDSADAVMEQLVELSEVAGSGVLDSAVDADSTDDTVTIEVTAAADDEGSAINQAITAMRTAIHTAGDGIPGWPTGDELVKLTESVGSELRVKRVETV